MSQSKSQEDEQDHPRVRLGKLRVELLENIEVVKTTYTLVYKQIVAELDEVIANGDALDEERAHIKIDALTRIVGKLPQ